MFSAGTDAAARPFDARVHRARAAPPDAVVRLDARLAELVRGEGRARVVLGELLDALVRPAGHHELGFSSLGAYAKERCGRSGRWANESRLLAQRLAALPQLRAALSGGAIGWCMAELVARHATAETDAELTALACRSTVREMRARWVAQPEQEMQSAQPETVTLGVTVSAEDAWLLQWTRRFAEQAFEAGTTDDFATALLQESYSSLMFVLPARDLAVFEAREAGGRRAGEVAGAARSVARGGGAALREEFQRARSGRHTRPRPCTSCPGACRRWTRGSTSCRAKSPSERWSWRVLRGRCTRPRAGVGSDTQPNRNTCESASACRRRASRRRSRWRGAGAIACAEHWVRGRSVTKRRS